MAEVPDRCTLQRATEGLLAAVVGAGASRHVVASTAAALLRTLADAALGSGAELGLPQHLRVIGRELQCRADMKEWSQESLDQPDQARRLLAGLKSDYEQLVNQRNRAAHELSGLLSEDGGTDSSLTSTSTRYSTATSALIPSVLASSPPMVEHVGVDMLRKALSMHNFCVPQASKVEVFDIASVGSVDTYDCDFTMGMREAGDGAGLMDVVGHQHVAGPVLHTAGLPAAAALGAVARAAPRCFQHVPCDKAELSGRRPRRSQAAQRQDRRGHAAVPLPPGGAPEGRPHRVPGGRHLGHLLCRLRWTCSSAWAPIRVPMST